VPVRPAAAPAGPGRARPARQPAHARLVRTGGPNLFVEGGQFCLSDGWLAAEVRASIAVAAHLC
jgi:hypothetical protein